MVRVDPEQMRAAFGRFPTGVAVVAGMTGDGPAGFSCNSLTSVSLEPPMAAFCVAKSSTTWPLLRDRGEFCISFLAAHQDELCRSFSRVGADRFTGIDWHRRDHGPGLDDAIVWLDCRTSTEVDAGDHLIVVVTVEGIETAAIHRDPLVFHQGAFATIGER